VSSTPRQASPKETPKSMLNTPDTGAGVLRFLTEDGEAPTAFSALSPAPDATTSPTTAGSSDSPPAPETPPRNAASTPWQTPVDEDPSTPPPPARPAPRGSDASHTDTVPGTVRVLAVLRELQDVGSEEPDAMMALELVVTELADPQSTLQQALRSSTDDRLERIWCPEAEGPCKASRRASATARARHSAAAFGTIARLRRAKGVG